MLQTKLIFWSNITVIVCMCRVRGHHGQTGVEDRQVRAGFWLVGGSRWSFRCVCRFSVFCGFSLMKVQVNSAHVLFADHLSACAPAPSARLNAALSSLQVFPTCWRQQRGKGSIPCQFNTEIAASTSASTSNKRTSSSPRRGSTLPSDLLFRFQGQEVLTDGCAAAPPALKKREELMGGATLEARVLMEVQERVNPREPGRKGQCWFWPCWSP